MYNLTYTSNGASSQFFSATADTPVRIETKDGTHEFCIILEYDNKPDSCRLMQGLYHRSAKLRGYFLKKQENGQVFWQTKSGSWTKLQFKALRRLYQPGEDIAGLFNTSAALTAIPVWQPYQTSKKISSGQPAVLYLGNGADSETYAELSSKNISCTQLHDGMGSHQVAVLCPLPKNSDEQKAYNCFHHIQGNFAGFYARKRTEKNWLWYTQGGTWQPAVSCTENKQLFADGDSVSCLFENNEKEVILEAQWTSIEDGRRIACGYPMYSNRLMAHGLGGYNGKSHCNCMAGFEQAMANQYSYFETDIHSTSDGRIVLYHGWFAPDDVKNMSFEELSALGNDGQPLMNARQLYPILKAHPSYTLELDLYNYKGKTIQDRIRALIADFEYDKTVLDRLLVQVHTIQMMKDIDKVYPFKHYQILSSKNLKRLEEIVTSCLDYGICAIGMRMNLAKKKYVQMIKSSGIYLMCFTVTKGTSSAMHLFSYGVDTLCTDYITLADLETAEDTFGKWPFYVYYNSGVADAGETYSEAINQGTLSGKVAINPSGTLEFRDSVMWANDGQQALADCHFTVEGKQFAGWNLRIKIDGKQLWLGTDGCYHANSDFSQTAFSLDKRLFWPGEKLPVWTMQKGIKYIMCAVWEDTV